MVEIGTGLAIKCAGYCAAPRGGVQIGSSTPWFETQFLALRPSGKSEPGLEPLDETTGIRPNAND